jgi:hypothetical protein
MKAGVCTGLVVHDASFEFPKNAFSDCNFGYRLDIEGPSTVIAKTGQF